MKHTHLHLNVQRTMSHAHITADLDRAFRSGADTIGLCEMETAWHHSEFKRLASRHGYTALTWGGAAGALAIAVRKSYGTVSWHASTYVSKGQKGLSPNRYVNRCRVVRHEDAKRIRVSITHQWASGWTGSKAQDALRKARWYMGMRKVRSVERTEAKADELSVGSGDLNRPPSTFSKRIPLPQLLANAGFRTSNYARTDGTHGRTIFDYLWVLSKARAVRLTAVSTPAFNSDHDGIRATLTW